MMLLAFAERACLSEARRCGSCVATCTKGKIWMAYNEVLMDDEIAKGRILCCQAYAVDGDAEIFV